MIHLGYAKCSHWGSRPTRWGSRPKKAPTLTYIRRKRSHDVKNQYLSFNQTKLVSEYNPSFENMDQEVALKPTWWNPPRPYTVNMETSDVTKYRTPSYLWYHRYEGSRSNPSRPVATS